MCCGENITFHQVAKFSVPLQADTLGSCGYVYLAVYPTSETKK
ncbi:hypothetical protein D9E41_08695 [Escherichia coli]|nr:hypothetical protein [Escherichia coli]